MFTCIVCNKNFTDENFAKQEGIPLYFKGSVKDPLNAEEYYCSCKCGTKKYNKDNNIAVEEEGNTESDI